MRSGVLYFLTILGVSWACYITDCPVGGKRSQGFGLQLYSNKYRRCPPCGSDLSGQCLGPNICCTNDACIIDPVNLSTCKEEALKMTACTIERSRCGPQNKGYCAVHRFCCTANACTEDESCSKNGNRDVLRESQTLI